MTEGPVAPTDRELIDGYLSNYRGDESYFWAFETVAELTSKDPERLWRITTQMISETTDELALAYIAAGPLEELLVNRGLHFIERIEREARSNSHFRECLRSVWGRDSMPPDVRVRLQKLAERDA